MTHYATPIRNVSFTYPKKTDTSEVHKWNDTGDWLKEAYNWNILFKENHMSWHSDSAISYRS